jgi:acetyl/propionyl-CoA carboxylase alpha subunit
MHYRYEYEGETYHIRIERLPDGRIQATLGERAYILRADALKQGGWLLTHEGENHLVYSAGVGDDRWVQVDGEHFHLQRQRGRRTQSSTRSAGDLTAQMPGQIMQVLVSSGDNVTSGQTLVILEAMKMEIRVSAPEDGVVKNVLVAVGQVVERGQILVEVASQVVT